MLRANDLPTRAKHLAHTCASSNMSRIHVRGSRNIIPAASISLPWGISVDKNHTAHRTDTQFHHDIGPTRAHIGPTHALLVFADENDTDPAPSRRGVLDPAGALMSAGCSL